MIRAQITLQKIEHHLTLSMFEAYKIEDEARHREHNLKLRANAFNQLKRRISKSLKFD